MDTLLQDVRFGLRMLRKSPAFTLIAIAALALGIGANTAIFSAVNAVLLHPLPFPHSDQVVHIREATPRNFGGTMSLPNFEDYTSAQKSFTELSLWSSQSVNYSGGDHPDRVIGSFASANFFHMLGVGAGMGRTFAPEDEKPGAPGVVVLAYNAWRDQFGADANILGRKLMLNGESYEVVGVLPRTFQMPWFDTDVWMTIQHYPNYRRDRAQTVGLVFGRIRESVSTSAATADLNTTAQRLAKEYPQASANIHIELDTVQDMINFNYKPMLLLLFAGVGAVLLIACANVANLLLARGSSRQREIAVRMAIGCSRFRILRQLLTESLLLAVIAGGAALLVGTWIMKVLVDLVPGGLPFYHGELDAPIVGFTLALSLVTGVLFGIAPGWHLARAPLLAALGSGTRTSAGGGHVWSPRSLFVVTQVALSVALLVSALLLVRSLQAMLNEDIGFNAGHLLTAEYRLPRTKYVTPESRWAFHAALLEKLRVIPGVQSAAIVAAGPYSGNGGSAPFLPPGATAAPTAQLPTVGGNVITPGYFTTLGIPLLRGRDFTESDTASAPAVVIITRSMADRYWPKGDALGQRAVFPDAAVTAGGGAATIDATVVGIVGDNKPASLAERINRPRAYLAYAQKGGIFGTLAIRTAVEPMTLAEQVKRAVWSVDADQPVWKIRTVELLIQNDSGPQRYMASLMIGFGVLAFVLTLIGTYGVVSYSVAQRTREFGIRLALGAVPRDLLRLVLKQGVGLAAAGAVIGVLLGAWATGFLRSMLYGVSRFDLPSFALAVGAIVAAALVASLVPARRATKVDPAVTLRYE